jgi:hypothetical protein
MKMPQHEESRSSGRRHGALLLAALILACLAAGAPARAKTITCGDQANPGTLQKLKAVLTAQSYTPGDDLEVVGTCEVEGGLMGGQSPSYRFGKVNIYSKKPDTCPLTVLPAAPCGGTLNFDDALIDFRASSIIIERGGSLIAGNPNTPIGTLGLGPDKTHSHVLTITLWGADPGHNATTSPTCKSPATGTTGDCGIPTGISGSVALPGGVTDLFFDYEPLFDVDRNSKGYFGDKVLAVSYGGVLQLFGKKGAAPKGFDTTTDPKRWMNPFNSWRRLNQTMRATFGPPTPEPGKFPTDGTTLNVEKALGTDNTTPQPVDWEKGDDVVVTTTDYLPGHSEQLKIMNVITGAATDPFAKFDICEAHPDCDTTKASCKRDQVCDPAAPPAATYYMGVNWRHQGVRYPLSTHKPNGVPSDSTDPALDASLLSRGAETRAAVGLLSRSIVIRSGGNGKDDPFPSIADCTFPNSPDKKCYFGGHMLARQGFQTFQVQGVEFAQLGQGGRLGRYPVHFHMARHTPSGTMVVDSSINESMTRWIVLHATQDVLVARNVGWKSIGHGFYLEEATEVNNKLFANLGIFARAAVVGHSDTDPDLALDANPRKVPGILAQKLETSPEYGDARNPPPPNNLKGPLPDGQDNTAFPDVANGTPLAIDRFPFHSDYNHPSVFWIMNGWNDFIGNMAAGAGTCGACYWLVPGANSGMSRDPKMGWVGYASRQKGLDHAASTPLKSFYGNSCTSAMFSFNTVSATSGCFAFADGDIAFQRKWFQPVKNPLAPKSCIVPGGGPYPADPNNCKTNGTDDPLVDDLSYYPTVDGAGGRFPLKCDETKDCSVYNDNKDPLHPAGSPRLRCANGDKTDVPGGAVDPNCTATVLDHYISSFNWGPNNQGAILLRPQWYLVTNSVMTDVQFGGLSFVTGGDYTRSSAINGLWQLAAHSIFIGNTQGHPDWTPPDPLSPFAENDGPFNPNNGGLKCDSLLSNFCVNLYQQWSIGFDHWSVNQRLFNIYDGPSSQDRNAYLDITPTIFDKCNANNPSVDNGCMQQNYPIAFGPNFGIMRDKIKNHCFLPNAAIGWKQPNGFYYPPAFHSSRLFFDNVDIRHFVTEPVFAQDSKNPQPGKKPYDTDDAAATDTFCLAVGLQNAFTGFTDVDRQTVLNDDDGSLTGLKHTLSVNKLSDFFTAPVEVDECASQTGRDQLHTPVPNAPAATAKTSPYDYVTTVLLPGCTQKAPIPSDKPTALCGCNGSGLPGSCTEWHQDCATPDCAGVPLYRMLLTKSETTAPRIRMAGQSSWQRSTLTANNGTYYIDTTYTAAKQQGEGFPNINEFRKDSDYFVFFVYAQGTTKQVYKLYVGGTDVKKGNAPGCTGTPTAPVTAPYLIRANIAGVPAKIKPNTTESKTTLSASNVGAYCYNETGNEPGVLTVHVDMTQYAGELSPKPDATFNAQCQPRTFCKLDSTKKNGCGCTLNRNDPMVLANPKLWDECDNACNNWAVKDLDCPIGGCIGFGVTLPSSFEPGNGPTPPFTLASSSGPKPACFPKPWNSLTGFTLVHPPVVQKQCEYLAQPATNFCQ